MPPASPDASLPWITFPGCPRCRRAMSPFRAEGHDAREVVLDVCEPCRLVWFDERESSGLAGAGWVGLLQHLLDVPSTLPAPDPRPVYRCPRCDEPLRLRDDQSRYGRYRLHGCDRCGGQLQHQTWLLARHGFCRPLQGPDRLALAREGRTLDCLTCGATLAARDEACTHCGTPPLVLDPDRLARALLRLPEARAAAVAPTRACWPCGGCGHPVDPVADEHCPQCGQLVLVGPPADVGPALEATRAAVARDEQAREALSARLAATPERSTVPHDPTLVGLLVRDRVAANQAMSRLDRPPTPAVAWRFAVAVIALFGAWAWWVAR